MIDFLIYKLKNIIELPNQFMLWYMYLTYTFPQILDSSLPVIIASNASARPVRMNLINPPGAVRIIQ